MAGRGGIVAMVEEGRGVRARSGRVVMMGKRTIPSSSFYIYRDKGTEAGEEPGSLSIWARSITATTIRGSGGKRDYSTGMTKCA
jgi:hypothetical protein